MTDPKRLNPKEVIFQYNAEIAGEENSKEKHKFIVYKMPAYTARDVSLKYIPSTLPISNKFDPSLSHEVSLELIKYCDYVTKQGQKVPLWNRETADSYLDVPKLSFIESEVIKYNFAFFPIEKIIETLPPIARSIVIDSFLKMNAQFSQPSLQEDLQHLGS